MSSVKVTKERIVEGPGSTQKTTTYETRSSYESSTPTYRPLVSHRQTIINRTAAGPRSGGSSMSVQRSQSYGLGAGLAPGSYQVISQTGISGVKEGRDKEKKDMQDLNERFASYIEKVRFLEAQNRKLADELDKLKQKWGKETTAIKAMYQAELDEARRLLDEAEKEKARLQIKVDSLDNEIEELRQQLEYEKSERIKFKEMYDDQCKQLIDMEAELKTLRQRIESLEMERRRDKDEIARLTDALTRARVDLDNETLAHIDAENRRQTLEEELEFLKQVHEQEMKELAALAYRDTTQENREFWKNEMGNALREIQSTYDEKMDIMRGEMETYYNMKVQEFRTGATRQNMETSHAKEETKRLRSQLSDLRAKLADLEARNAQLEKELQLMRMEYDEKEREWETENTELKNEVAKLRAEMEAILKELQDLMDTKLGLELEIAAYRKLLEGEENRFAYNVLSGLTQLTSAIQSYSSKGGDTKQSQIRPKPETVKIQPATVSESQKSPSAPSQEDILEEPQSLPDPTSPFDLKSQAELNPESENETEPDQEAFESEIEASKMAEQESTISAVSVDTGGDPGQEPEEEAVVEMEEKDVESELESQLKDMEDKQSVEENKDDDIEKQPDEAVEEIIEQDKIGGVEAVMPVDRLDDAEEIAENPAETEIIEESVEKPIESEITEEEVQEESQITVESHEITEESVLKPEESETTEEVVQEESQITVESHEITEELVIKPEESETTEEVVQEESQITEESQEVIEQEQVEATEEKDEPADDNTGAETEDGADVIDGALELELVPEVETDNAQPQPEKDLDETESTTQADDVIIKSDSNATLEDTLVETEQIPADKSEDSINQGDEEQISNNEKNIENIIELTEDRKEESVQEKAADNDTGEIVDSKADEVIESGEEKADESKPSPPDSKSPSTEPINDKGTSPIKLEPDHSPLIESQVGKEEGPVNHAGSSYTRTENNI